MISHKHKVIFIHIPKCAGSSVEYFFNVKPFNWKEPNYETLTGWCPKRNIHLHHATPKQLLETDLIKEEVWNSYTKFAIVRNPWSRAYSDYIWLNRFNIINTTFINFLNKKGNLTDILNNNKVKEYRGDHLLPQVDFLKLKDELVIDNLIFFENLKADFEKFLLTNNIPMNILPHDKKSKKFIKHYSHFFNDNEIKLVEDIYKEDIKVLNYTFEDKRDQISNIRKKYIQFIRRIK